VAFEDSRLRTAFLGWFIAFAIAVLEGADWWSLHARLTVVGWATEALGLTLLASDLLAEPTGAAVARVWRTTRSYSRRTWARLLRRRLIQVIHVGMVESAATMSDGVIGTRVRGRATLEQLAADMSELDAKLQLAQQRQQQLADELRSEIARSRDQVIASIDDAIEGAKTAYRSWRLGGFMIALFGSSLLAAANLVS
jgi:hypothetical protein